MNTDKKKRNLKTNSQQLEILLTFLQTHKNWLTPVKNTSEDENDFKFICEELSNVKNGAKKSSEEWKRFIITWKSKTKAKARLLKKEHMKTGGGMHYEPNLSEQEEQLMALIGWNVIHGCENVSQEIEPEDVLIEMETTNLENEVQGIEKSFNVVIEQNAEVVLEGEELNYKSFEQKINDIQNVVDNQNKKKGEYEIQKRKNTIHKSTANKVPRKRTDLQSAADTYFAESENILQAAKVIADSINTHAAALNECASAINLKTQQNK